MAIDSRPTVLQLADDSCLDLARFDRPEFIALDPAIRAANLAALHEVHPELAAAVAAAALPAHWRAASGLDGAPTFRVEQPGQPAAWLAGAAAPNARARGLLEGYDALGKNPALPCAGAGGEVRTLLERLAPQLALHVFEHDVVQLAAVLRLVDCAAAIRDRRLILVPPGNEVGYLTELLELEPGLLPPGTILTPILVDAERLSGIQRVCERVFAESTLTRQRRLAAVQQAEARRAVGADAPPRLALVAMSLDRATQARVRAIQAAAERLGCATATAVFRTPADAHPLAHVERLSHFAPTLSLWVGHDPSVLTVPLAGGQAVWVQSPHAAPAAPTPGVKYLATTPRVQQALRDAGIAGESVADWYWAADERRFEIEAVPPATANAVVVVGDLPALSADALALTLDSQRSLWDCVRSIVRANWETELVGWPERVLLAAEKAARYSIRDPALREHFLRLVAQVAIPGESLMQVIAALRSGGRVVSAIGAGWRAHPDPGIDVLAEDATLLPLDAFTTMTQAPCGLVFAGANDPLSPALVELTACGLPLALHAPAGVNLCAALGGIIDPARDLQRFTTRQQLLESVESFVSLAARRRAERLRAQVCAAHTWTSRVQALLALLAPGQ
jgi:hypothetical protein